MMSRCLAAALLAAALLSACGGGGDATSAAASAAPAPQPAASELKQPFAAVGSSATTVSLAWTPPEGSGARYVVERRSGSSGEFAAVATVDARSGGFLDGGLAANTAYGYRLAAAAGPRSETPAQTATTTQESAVVTPLGAALGEASARSVGRAGATLASADGSIGVQLPAGAFDADVAVETQSVANTAPDGRGTALKVRLAAAPAAPLALSVRYDAADDDQASAMRIAIQRPGGDWTSLPLAAIDPATRTLQAQLPPEFVASARAGAGSGSGVWLEFRIVKYLAFHLAPRTARVKVRQTLELVPYARVRGYDTEIGTCEPLPDGRRVCLLQPMLEVREMPFTNDKPGFSRVWLVNAVTGGNAAVGTVAPHAGVGATYTAPAAVPSPSTVRVLFHSLNMTTLRAVDLIALVEIYDDTWTGAFKAVDGPSITGTTITSVATVHWTPDPAAAAGAVKVYRATGRLDVAVTDDDCTVTVTPSSQPVATEPRLVELRIDESKSPMTYTARLITVWPATLSGVCPRGGATQGTRSAGWGWDVSGEVAADGRTIEGEAVTEDGYRLSWRFTR